MKEIEHDLATWWEQPWCMDRWEIINHLIKRYKFYENKTTNNNYFRES